MKCAGCLKSVKDSSSIKCTSSACDNSFCLLCINVPSITPDRKKTWKCPDCCALQKKGGDNSLTPVRVASEPQNVTARKKADSAPEDTASVKSEIKELTAVITRLTGEFTALKTKLEEVTQSLCYCHERMDELQRNVSSNDNRLKQLEKRDKDVANLQVTVALLQNELNVQAQQNLLNEIEIVGIPESSNENLEHVVKVAALKVGVRLEDGDVDWITRVGARRPLVQAGTPELGGRMPRPVVVRFLRRSKRNQIIRASKSRKNITSTDLDITGPTTKVFFNERLTRENRILFRETRIRAKCHEYSFCWCNQGAIYIRQREGKAAQIIRSLQNLDLILPSAPVDTSS